MGLTIQTKLDPMNKKKIVSGIKTSNYDIDFYQI